ncbi:hypothetical protein NQ176_g9943 [Zarea fungicola]|uniref:Uncharacterized protein n=1 Tax=Zarea fungicola TaxID=93591 RepID=A0ACC1MJZ3_9HYPO|nr:hypothetical protein NQ176_g9943 [Lecanicillium fungicola]
MDKFSNAITFKLPCSSGELVLTFDNVTIAVEPLRLQGNQHVNEPCGQQRSVTPQQAIPTLLARSAAECNMESYVLNVQLERPSISLKLGDCPLEEQFKRIAAYAAQLDSLRTFDADKLVRYLVCRTQHSLENLVLDVGPGVIATPLRSSIKALARLRHLKLSTALCIGRELQVSRLYPVTGRPNSAAVYDTDNDVVMLDIGTNFLDDESGGRLDGNATRVWCLADTLPANLETIQVNMPNEAGHVICLEEMFRGFEAQRAARFPRLTRIDVHVTVYINCRHQQSSIHDKELEQCWNEFVAKNRFIQPHVRREKCHCC